MKVLVDASVWMLALGRRTSTPAQRAVELELADLILAGRVRLIGPVRQQLLAALADDAQFDQLREPLRHFADEPLTTEDHEDAARCAHRCRAAGVTGATTDFLLCAVALRRGWSVFTTDASVIRCAEVLKVGLHQARSVG